MTVHGRGFHNRRSKKPASAPATMPSGATGLWLMNNYQVQGGAGYVPNSASAQAVVPQQIIRQSRRIDANQNYNSYQAGISLEAHFAGSDKLPSYTDRFGNPEAIRITLSTAGTSGWLYQNPYSYSGAGTYTVCCDVRLVSGGGKFKIGSPFAANSGELTATSSWQRFAWTGAGAGSFGIGHDAIPSNTVLEINNFNVFTGSSDLGAETFGAHLKLAVMNNASGNKGYTYASGVITSGDTAGWIEFETEHQPSATTIFFYGTVIQPFVDAGLQGILSQPYNDGYMAGLNVSASGLGLAYGQDGTGGVGLVALVPIGGAAPITVWDNTNPHVYAVRWDGTTGSWWQDGVKLYSGTATPAYIPKITQLVFNRLTSHPCNFKHKAMAYYLRALSDAEMVAAGSYLVANA